MISDTCYRRRVPRCTLIQSKRAAPSRGGVQPVLQQRFLSALSPTLTLSLPTTKPSKRCIKTVHATFPLIAMAHVTLPVHIAGPHKVWRCLDVQVLNGKVRLCSILVAASTTAATATSLGQAGHRLRNHLRESGFKNVRAPAPGGACSMHFIRDEPIDTCMRIHTVYRYTVGASHQHTVCDHARREHACMQTRPPLVTLQTCHIPICRLPHPPAAPGTACCRSLPCRHRSPA